jgi:hypothetical protein
VIYDYNKGIEMGLILDINTMREILYRISGLIGSLDSCISFIDDKMGDGRISSKDYDAVINLMSQTTDHFKVFSNKLDELNSKYIEIEKIIQRDFPQYAADSSEQLFFSLADTGKKLDFLGIQIKMEDFQEFVYDTNNDQSGISLLLDQIEGYKNNSDGNFEDNLSELKSSMENLIQLFKCTIDHICNILKEKKLLKTTSEVINEMDYDTGEYDEDARYIFMPF